MLPCRLLTLLSFVVVLLSWLVSGPSRWLRALLHFGEADAGEVG
jgi:hypothetical protein